MPTFHRRRQWGMPTRVNEHIKRRSEIAEGSRSMKHRWSGLWLSVGLVSLAGLASLIASWEAPPSSGAEVSPEGPVQSRSAPLVSRSTFVVNEITRQNAALTAAARTEK